MVEVSAIGLLNRIAIAFSQQATRIHETFGNKIVRANNGQGFLRGFQEVRFTADYPFALSLRLKFLALRQEELAAPQGKRWKFDGLEKTFNILGGFAPVDALDHRRQRGNTPLAVC